MDSDRIGQYTLWQGNRDSPVLVIGQDFSDEGLFVENGGRPGRDVGTNKMLMILAGQPV